MYEYLKLKTKDIDEGKTMLFFEGKCISKRQFFLEIDRVANFLVSSGIQNGDVITLNLPNTVNAIVLFYAVNKCGAIANIIHPLMHPDYILNSVIKTNSKMLFSLDLYYLEYRKELSAFNIPIVISRVSDYLPFPKNILYKAAKEEKIEGENVYFFASIGGEPKNSFLKNKEGVAAYLHSGGTTGDAKTIILSGSAFNALSESLGSVIDDMNPYRNASLMVLPLFHGFGLGVCMHAILSHGMESVILIKFNAAKSAELIKKRKVTIMTGVPLMYEKLLSLPDKDFIKLNRLENMFCGGDKLTEVLKSKFDKRLLSIGNTSEVLEGYGLTETVTVCTINRKKDYSTNCMGYPIGDIDIVIVDDEGNILPPLKNGEIYISGSTLMEGYLEKGSGDPFKMFDGKKYVATGDLGYTDHAKRLFFVDRKKRVVKISGFNVYPKEIEGIVNELEQINFSAAVYSNESGRMRLHIELKEGKEDSFCENMLMDMLTKRLIRHAVPEAIIVHKKLPRTAVGKIDIKKLD